VSEQLENGTFVLIKEFESELKNVPGTVVGYIDNAPLVQLARPVSDKYPYTTLIIPERCLITMRKRESAREYDFEELLHSAIMYSNLHARWRTALCHKLYQNLMGEMMCLMDGQTPPPYDIEVVPFVDCIDHIMPAISDVSVERHYFELKISWQGVSDYKRYSCKQFPDTEFNFKIVCNELWQANEGTWLDTADWHGICEVSVSRIDENLTAQKPRKSRNVFHNLSFTYTLDKGLDLQELVSNWDKLCQKINAIA
jgi:hypothetical protein